MNARVAGSNMRVGSQLRTRMSGSPGCRAMRISRCFHYRALSIASSSLMHSSISTRLNSTAQHITR